MVNRVRDQNFVEAIRIWSRRIRWVGDTDWRVEEDVSQTETGRRAKGSFPGPDKSDAGWIGPKGFLYITVTETRCFNSLWALGSVFFSCLKTCLERREGLIIQYVCLLPGPRRWQNVTGPYLSVPGDRTSSIKYYYYYSTSNKILLYVVCICMSRGDRFILII
jgi:hypothetical protein